MAIIISNGWDVAHHHIHEAFGHMGEACKTNLHATSEYRKIENSINWSSCLAASGTMRSYFVNENKLAIKAIILFQAGMEAWISWAYTQGGLAGQTIPNNFVKKWEDAFTALGSSFDFSSYADFYRNYRNPSVHPSTQGDVEKVAAICSKPVHEGIKSGWQAMAELSHLLSVPFDSDSWETMCKINGVPSAEEISLLGDLCQFERILSKKHIDGARKASGS
jgi:hypothetical protein